MEKIYHKVIRTPRGLKPVCMPKSPIRWKTVSPKRVNCQTCMNGGKSVIKLPALGNKMTAQKPLEDDEDGPECLAGSHCLGCGLRNCPVGAAGLEA